MSKGKVDHETNTLEPLVLYIAPGTATAEQIAELLTALSDLYRLMGGSGIQWSVRPAAPQASGGTPNVKRPV